MTSKQQLIEQIDRAAGAGERAARQIADPERRAKAMALAEQIKVRTRELQKVVKRPVRGIVRQRDRGSELER